MSATPPCGPRLWSMTCLVGLVLAGWLSGAAAQTAAPLRKSDLVRLLANPLIERKEVAEVVRRNCLAFRPTDRDWSDLRSLGADSDVLGSVSDCVARGTLRVTSPAALPPASLIAASLTPRVVAVAGEHALVQIQVRRPDGTQARGVTLALHAAFRGPGGPAGDVKAVTDDSGLAVFDVAVGRLAGRYRLELVSGSGGALPGRPVIDLVVAPGPPATVDVQPPRLVLGAPRDAALGLLVTVRDSLGNGLPHEPIELWPGSRAMGIPADTQATDSLGRASFVVRRAAVRRPGPFEIRARGVTLAALDAVLSSTTTSRAAPAQAVEPEFVQGGVPHGLARTRLADAVTFEVRSLSGTPLAGRTVRFQAVNAEVDRDSAVTDSAGQVRLDVTLGTKAGIAVVSAVVDSVRKADTLTVEPGVAVELVLERDGQRVDGGRILVEQDVPFNLTLRARDRYGNAASSASLTGRLQELRAAYNGRPGRLLDLLAVQPEGAATVLTFKPVRRGNTDLTLDIGLTATVSIQVAPRGK